MIVHAASVTVKVPADAFLAWFVPRSPVGLFDRWGPIPGVAEVAAQSGPWTSPGSHRMLRLTDGSRVREEVVECHLPERFAYRMSGFGGVMARLVTGIGGTWRCEAAGPGAASVTWSYAFEDRGWAQRLVLRAMIRAAWQGYMDAAMRRVAEAAQAELRRG